MCVRRCGCNSDSMSSLYPLQNSVTIPEVARIKNKEEEKKWETYGRHFGKLSHGWGRHSDTCPQESLINLWACPTFIDDSSQSHNHLSKLVFPFLLIFPSYLLLLLLHCVPYYAFYFSKAFFTLRFILVTEGDLQLDVIDSMQAEETLTERRAPIYFPF